jgi:hypothetical protein
LFSIASLFQIEELRQNRAAGRAAVDSAKLADAICRKFLEFPGVSYADVAQKAAECELNELATLVRWSVVANGREQ